MPKQKLERTWIGKEQRPGWNRASLLQNPTARTSGGRVAEQKRSVTKVDESLARCDAFLSAALSSFTLPEITS